MRDASHSATSLLKIDVLTNRILFLYILSLALHAYTLGYLIAQPNGRNEVYGFKRLPSLVDIGCCIIFWYAESCVSISAKITKELSSAVGKIYGRKEPADRHILNPQSVQTKAIFDHFLTSPYSDRHMRSAWHLKSWHMAAFERRCCLDSCKEHCDIVVWLWQSNHWREFRFWALRLDERVGLSIRTSIRLAVFENRVIDVNLHLRPSVSMAK